MRIIQWMAVVADLDVALRIRAQVDARGCALRATMSARCVCNSRIALIITGFPYPLGRLTHVQLLITWMEPFSTSVFKVLF